MDEACSTHWIKGHRGGGGVDLGPASGKYTGLIVTAPPTAQAQPRQPKSAFSRTVLEQWWWNAATEKLFVTPKAKKGNQGYR